MNDLLREQAPRTVPAVSTSIGRILDAFTTQDCTNYFANAGYSLT